MPRLTLRQRTLLLTLALGMSLTLTCAAGLQSLPFFARTELSIYDWQMTNRGVQPVPANIALVAVDNQSVRTISNGRYPIPRAAVARAVSVLHHDGARAIGLDFLYVNPSTYGSRDDMILARSLRAAGNVVLGEQLEGAAASNNVASTVSLFPPIDELARAAAGSGVLNVPQDSDGVIRSSQLLQQGPASCLGSSPLCMSRIPVLPLQLAAVALGRSTAEIARDLPASMLINYRGDLQRFPLYQFQSVAAGEDPPRLFRNKIVLIIPAANAAKDVLQAPFGTTYGGVIQANILATILNRDPIHPAGDLENTLLLLLVGTLATFAAGSIGIWRSTSAVLALTGLVVAAAFALFDLYAVWLHVFTPVVTVVVVFAGVMALRFGTEERQRRKTGRIFGQYVRPEIVDMLVNADNPEAALAGHRRPISVLFVDIRGFTAMSETMKPEDVLACLDVYLENLTRCVVAFDGTLDKYVGDELMAIWNAPREQPDHALLAVRAALAMMDHEADINAKLETQGLPAVRYGIGINTGTAVVGQMGSSMRKQYTVIGDTVNTGARLCSVAKAGEIVIGEGTRNQIAADLPVEESELLSLKGKSAPVRTFRVLAPDGTSARPTTRNVLTQTSL